MIKIYQNYYSEETKKHCKSYFEWHDNTGNNDGEYEYSVMKKIYHQPWDDITHKGVLSWKFESKINHWLKQERIKTKHNPSLFFHATVHSEANKYDVIHLNPEIWCLRELPGCNVWRQGLQWHPEIIDFLKRINIELGIGKHWLDIQFTERTLIFCNYWVANKKFWDLWMSYAERIYPIAKESTIFPYIMERIAPCVLHDHQEELNILPCTPLLLK